MLEIISKSGVSLDIYPNTTIDITIENPFMYADKIPAPYSLDLDLPASTANVMLLGNPQSITSVNVVSSISIIIKFDGIAFFDGNMVVNSVNGRTINVNMEGVIFNGNFQTPCNEIAMDEFMFGDLNTNKDEQDKLDALLKSAANGAENFVIAPVRDSSRKWEAVTAYPVLNYTSVIRNSYNEITSNFIFIEYGRAFLPQVTPLIKASYLFDKVTAGMVDKNIFTDAPFNQLVIIPSWKQYGGKSIFGLEYDWINSKLRLNKALTDSPAGDVLKELLKLVCASLVAVGHRFELRYNRDIINDNTMIDWTDKVEDSITIQREKGEKYKWGFKARGNRDVTGALLDVENVKSMVDYVTSKDEQSFKIKCTGEIFKRKREENELVYENVYPNLGKDEDDAESEFDATCSLLPVINNIEKYLEVNNGEHFWKMQSIPSVDFSFDKRDDMYIGIYHGYRPTIGQRTWYPYVSSHNYDVIGNRCGNLSLSSLDGSLLHEYHKDFEQWTAKTKVSISTRVNLSILDIRQFNITTKVYVKGVRFYVKTLTMHITPNKIDLSDVELLEA